MPLKECIVPSGKASSKAPYSSAVRYGDVIYTSGYTAVDQDGKTPEGIAAQTRMCLDDIKAVLEAAGSSLDKVLKVNVYITHMDDYAEMNMVYREYFLSSKPARACVQVAALTRPEKRIEIEAIAGV